MGLEQGGRRERAGAAELLPAGDRGDDDGRLGARLQREPPPEQTALRGVLVGVRAAPGALVARQRRPALRHRLLRGGVRQTHLPRNPPLRDQGDDPENKTNAAGA